MLDGDGPAAQAARLEPAAAGRSAIDSPAKAFGELLVGLRGRLGAAADDSALPIALVQVARYADPTTARRGAAGAAARGPGPADRRARRAWHAFRPPIRSPARRATPSADPDRRQARSTRRWRSAQRQRSPRRRRAPATSRGSATSLTTMKRHAEAADAYGRAIRARRGQASADELWTLHAAPRERARGADRWPEAKRASSQLALALAPDQPLLLNFLGYGKLERGEDLDAAEAMIRKAQRASRPTMRRSPIRSAGRCTSAAGSPKRSTTLQRAARRPTRPGRNPRASRRRLYTSGRRYEARFAWRAALVNAEDEIASADRGEDRRRPDAGHRRALMPHSPSTAPAKLNLALHVRGQAARRPARDRDVLRLLHRRRPAERGAGGRTVAERRRAVRAPTLREDDNLVLAGGARRLRERAGVSDAAPRSSSTRACRSRRASAAARPTRRRRCGC